MPSRRGRSHMTRSPRLGPLRSQSSAAFTGQEPRPVHPPPPPENPLLMLIYWHDRNLCNLMHKQRRRSLGDRGSGSQGAVGCDRSACFHGQSKQNSTQRSKIQNIGFKSATFKSLQILPEAANICSHLFISVHICSGPTSSALFQQLSPEDKSDFSG